MRFSKAVLAALKGHEPSLEQEAAITHAPVPLAIIAGAGSGKTAVMAARIVWMTEMQIADPAEILGLSFTNKAAGELEQRIRDAFAQLDRVPPEVPSVLTYNSLADRIVREHGVRIGIDPEVGLLSEGQSWQLILKALERVGPFDAIDSRSARSLCRDGLSLAEQCDNQLLTPEAVAAEDQRIIDEGDPFGEEALIASRKRKELAGLVRAYIDMKRSSQRIDYGDQVAKAVEVLETFPQVAADLRATFPAILLDEYQDTNVAQRRMLEALIREPEASGAGNITAVGDARQNIFQWRGSTLFNLIDFPKHFPRRGGQPHQFLSLSENFRSGARILDVANRIIEPVAPDRRPGEPLRPCVANGDGFVGVKLLSDQRREAMFISDEIAALHGQSAGEGRQPMSWSDFAILVRRRKHIAPIYEALRDADIPVEVVGLGGLLEVPEVVDVIAWLRVLADSGPSGNRWLARILFGPRFRVHYRDLALLARWAEAKTRELARQKEQSPQASAPDGGVVPDTTKLEPDEVAFSLTEALDHIDEISELPVEAHARLSEARSDFQQLRAAAHASLPDLVYKVIQVSGLGAAISASPREDAAAAGSNLRQFVGVVDSFAPVSGQVTLSEFLAYLDAAEEAEDSLELQTGGGGDSVKLMTVHSAKGLEFETVFIPGVAARQNDKGEKVDSIFPDTRTTNPLTSPSQLPHAVRADAEYLPRPWEVNSRGERVLKKPLKFREELKDRAVEDERRLFYVALTRAKQRLYVTAAWWYERNLDCRGPSVFFSEVRDLEAVDDLGEEPKPEASPLIHELRARAIWPADPPNNLMELPELGGTYPEVLGRVLSGTVSVDELLSRLDETSRTEAERSIAQHRMALETLSDTATLSGASDLPAVLSATRAVALGSGEMLLKDLKWPVPQPPSPARRIGNEVHSLIEEQARSLTGLADEEGFDEPSRHIPAGTVAELRSNFQQMGYSRRKLARVKGGEPMAELPFVLKLGGRLLRGRIDAVYEAEDGISGLEIVDFKTGAEVESPEIDQLMVYAGALAKLGVNVDRPIRLTFCYLASRQTRSRTIEGSVALEALEKLEQKLNSLDLHGSAGRS